MEDWREMGVPGKVTYKKALRDRELNRFGEVCERCAVYDGTERKKTGHPRNLHDGGYQEKKSL